MTLRTLLSAVTLATALTTLARGELIWKFVATSPETVVVDTDMVRHVEALQRDIPFNSFRYPQYSHSGDIAFIVDDPVKRTSAKNDLLHGIYLSRHEDGQIMPIVEIGDITLGDKQHKLHYLRGLQTDGESYVFQNWNGNPYAMQIFHWSRKTGLKVIAQAGHGPEHPYTHLGYAAVSGRMLIFQATTENGGTGLYLHDLLTDSTRLLINTKSKPAATNGRPFERISPQNWIHGNRIIFRADFINAETDKTHTPHPSDDGQGGSRGIYGWDNVNPDDPSSWALDKLITHADGTTPVPLSDGKRFCYIASAPVNGDLIAFNGGWYGQHGIHVIRNGEIKVVVDTNTSIPGLFDGTFSGFNKWVSVMPGKVMFIGNAEDYTGIFLYDATTDSLFSLYDNNDTIEEKEILNFEIGSTPLIGDRFAATVRFKDNSSGIYLFRLPEKAFSRSQ